MHSNVKRIMEEKGFTVRGLMAETGFANKTVLNARSHGKIETCTLRTLAKIARALGVTTKDLYDDDDQETTG
jgi:DNA-binding Xre family transcriptional regulator